MNILYFHSFLEPVWSRHHIASVQVTLAEDFGVGARGTLLAQRVLPELDTAGDAPLDHDSSTNALIRRYRRQRSAVPPSTQA